MLSDVATDSKRRVYAPEKPKPERELGSEYHDEFGVAGPSKDELAAAFGVQAELANELDDETEASTTQEQEFSGDNRPSGTDVKPEKLGGNMTNPEGRSAEKEEQVFCTNDALHPSPRLTDPEEVGEKRSLAHPAGTEQTTKSPRVASGEAPSKREKSPDNTSQLDQLERKGYKPIASHLFEGFSTSTGGNLAAQGDHVVLRSDTVNHMTPSRVRLRIRGRDVGRIPLDQASHLSPLLYHNYILAEGFVLEDPGPRLRLNSSIIVYVKVWAKTELFGDQPLRTDAEEHDRSLLQASFLNLARSLDWIKHPELKQGIKVGFYMEEAIKLTDAQKKLADSIPGLNCSLREYQKHGVSWMILREAGLGDTNVDTYNPLWKEVTSLETLFYFNPSTLSVSLTRPKISGESCKGGILADEMGLGKTVQAIGVILANPPPPPSESEQAAGMKRGGTLVVCPTTILSQWQEEIATHSDGLRVAQFYGVKRLSQNAEVLTLEESDVVVTTYGILASDSTGHKFLTRTKWHRVILDEAHCIKSGKTKTARAAFELEARSYWCLTGTPVQNQPNDLYSLLRFMKSSPWGNQRFWHREVMSKHNSGSPEEIQNARVIIRHVLAPLMLRRTKHDRTPDGRRLLELPERITEICSIVQEPAERDFYNALYSRSRTSFDTYVAQGKVLSNMVSVLTLLLRLRQCCDHPFLFLSAPSSDVDMMKNLSRFAKRFVDSSASARGVGGVEDGRPNQVDGSQPSAYKENMVKEFKDGKRMENEECPICLDMMEDAVIATCGHGACRDCLSHCFGSSDTAFCPVCRAPIQQQQVLTAPRSSRFSIDIKEKWQPSSKVSRLLADLKSIRENSSGDKAVVFSQWTSMLDLLEVPLTEEGISFLRLDGAVPPQKRPIILKEFALNSGDSNVLLVSTKAGGVGLNLTMANHVIILDPWWNPAVEEQAIGRVHRIGQDKKVYVKRYIVKDSVEERLLDVQRMKQELVDGVVEQTPAEAREARLEEIKLLFS
ncbi:hypothetical protein NDN08_005648 [Rhodosorus marinus]|uniref:Anaphase-promoting complex subunit 11 n=1 Tax=Rhodosorus marinus TaxID=101924 RepID=A0AAV8V4M3_9RHOD|nr:hypothetical protein NDN08_005648 [Rhodosorus marinus]